MLLEAIYRLKRNVAFHDGLFGVHDEGPENEFGQLREKRWAVYVARAVRRFEVWWSKCDLSGGGRLTLRKLAAATGASQESWVEGNALQFDQTNIPPLGKLQKAFKAPRKVAWQAPY